MSCNEQHINIIDIEDIPDIEDIVGLTNKANVVDIINSTNVADAVDVVDVADVADAVDVADVIKSDSTCKKQQVLRNIISGLVSTDCASRDEADKYLKKAKSANKTNFSNSDFYQCYETMCNESIFEYNKKYEELLQKRSVRSQSGVMVFTVVLSPYPDGQTFSCKFDCKYCPKQPGQPRSYLKEEPAVSRANRHNFDPVLQFRDRGFTYKKNGHPVDKAEVIVLGGTWSSYPDHYQIDFIHKIYYAANTFYDDLENIDSNNLRDILSLYEEMIINESARCKVIGLTIETRPDCVNEAEQKKFRMLGVTRVQIGIQHILDIILKRVNRRCSSATAIKAIKSLKNNCFKVDAHWMPDLPKPLKAIVNQFKKGLEINDVDWEFDMYEADREMFNTITVHPDWQVDQWKIYPFEVVPYTDLEDEYNRGLHKPYSEMPARYLNPEKFTRLHELLIEIKMKVPKTVRLNRIIRDIPSQYIIGGNSDVSARQLIQNEMKKQNLKCKCIRCREIKKEKVDFLSAQLFNYKFMSSGSNEHFLSFETPDEEKLFGFLRLRLNPESDRTIVFDELHGCALIRELHVYGKTTSTDNKDKTNCQHVGFGTRLLEEAFKIAKMNNYNKIAVISGNGVKNYYRKFGFVDKTYFMIKDLTNFQNIQSRDISINSFDSNNVIDQKASDI